MLSEYELDDRATDSNEYEEYLYEDRPSDSMKSEQYDLFTSDFDKRYVIFLKAILVIYNAEAFIALLITQYY